MKKRYSVIWVIIILICGLGIIALTLEFINDDKPKYVEIEKDAKHADHYVLGDKVSLEESEIKIIQLEKINELDSIIKTEFDDNQISVFTSYYSVYYGKDDILNKNSGIRLENDQIIINNSNQADYNQLIIIDNYTNKICAVIDL